MHPHLFTSGDLPQPVSGAQVSEAEEALEEHLSLPEAFPGLYSPPSQAVEATCHESFPVLSGTLPLQ